MKQMRFLLIATVVFCSAFAYADQENTHVYKEELENFKELTYWQRLARFEILALDTIVVTADTMPKLYVYIDTMCKKAGIKTPTIFITVEKGFFNAMAMKLFKTTGAIVIGQKMLQEINDRELEAIVAHEIGHIKYDHANKMVCLILANLTAVQAIKYYLTNRFTGSPTSFDGFCNGYLALIAAGIMTNFMINKKFERQADEFAYREMGNGEGLVEAFEQLQEKELKNDENFDYTYANLEANQSKLKPDDYLTLKIGYYLAKGTDYLNKGYRWVYHNTPFGPHPSLEARIETIQAYLDEQAEKQEAN